MSCNLIKGRYELIRAHSSREKEFHSPSEGRRYFITITSWYNPACPGDGAVLSFDSISGVVFTARL